MDIDQPSTSGVHSIRTYNEEEDSSDEVTEYMSTSSAESESSDDESDDYENKTLKS